MRHKRTLTAAIMAFCLTSALALGAPAKVQPRLKLAAGQRFKLKVASDSKMVQTVNGEKQTVIDSAAMVFAFECQSLDEIGDMTLKVTYDSVRFNEDAPMGKIAFDSTTGAEVPPLVRGMAALVGQGFTMRITPDGRVRSVTGADEIVAKAIEKHNVLSEPWKSSMSTLLHDRFGNSAAQESMQGLFDVYPDKPVAVNERWTKKMELPQFTAESFFRITERKDGILTIKTFYNITPNPDAAPIKMGLVSTKSEAVGKMEGTLTMEEATGIMRSLKATSTSTGNLVILQGDSELRIPTSIQTTTSVEKM